MSLVKLPITKATNGQLMYFARSVLNIEVRTGSNNGQIIAKIQQAQPDIEEIQVPADMIAGPETIIQPSDKPQNPEAPEPNRIPDGPAGRHSKYDPVVEIEILPTADLTKPKTVTISVRGEIITVMRGKRVNMPYRYYLALVDAVEMVFRDTDEINPLTGMPIKEYVEQLSYPHQVFSRPSDEDIAAWHARTDDLALA